MCLSGMAALGVGWSYEKLLVEMVGTATLLGELRGMKPLA
jgi:hypothetical protein